MGNPQVGMELWSCSSQHSQRDKLGMDGISVCFYSKYALLRCFQMLLIVDLSQGQHWHNVSFVLPEPYAVLSLALHGSDSEWMSFMHFCMLNHLQLHNLLGKEAKTRIAVHRKRQQSFQHSTTRSKQGCDSILLANLLP